MAGQSHRNKRLLGVTMSADLYERVERLAKELGVEKAAIGRMAIKLGLNEHEKGKPFPDDIWRTDEE